MLTKLNTKHILNLVRKIKELAPRIDLMVIDSMILIDFSQRLPAMILFFVVYCHGLRKKRIILHLSLTNGVRIW